MFSHDVLRFSSGGGGQVGGSPGEKGQEVEEERAGSRIPKVAGTWTNLENFCNIDLIYFSIEMGQNHYGKGWEVEDSDPLLLPPSHHYPVLDFQ